MAKNNNNKPKKTKTKKAKRQAGALGIKRPMRGAAPQEQLKIPSVKNPPTNDNAKVLISLVGYDRDKNWGARGNRNDCPHKVMTKLSEIEKMTWQSFKSFNPDDDHHVDPSQIGSDAQKRIRQIRLDDFDELWSIRISSKGRVWGIRRASTLSILWWDPLHLVWPTQPRNT